MVGRRSRPRILVAAAIAIVAVSRCRGGRGGDRAPADRAVRSRRPAVRRRDRRRRASTSPTTGQFAFVAGGGVAVLDCDDDGRPDLYLAGGERTRPALFRNDSAAGGRAPVHAGWPTPATDLDGVIGAYPARHRRRRPRRSRGPARRRERHAPARPRRLPLRAGPTSAGASPAVPPGPTAFSATWEGGDACRRSRSATTSTRGDQRSDDRCARQRAGPARRRRRRATAPPVPLTPGCCALSMLFSDWDRSGRRDLRVSNDRHYYADAVGEEQLWRMAPGEPPRLYTAADGWGAVQIWGMGIASQDLTGDGLPEVYLTSQGDNKLQTLAAGPAQPDLPRHRPRARASSRPTRSTGGDALPVDRLAPRVRGRQQRRLHRPVRLQGQRRRRSPTTRSRDPSNLLLGQPDGTFVEGAEAAGHRALRPRPRRRPRRPQPRRPARPRRGEPRRRRCGSGATSGRARPSPGADGPLARAPARRSRARTATRSGRCVEVRAGDATIRGAR